jgi:predicted transcriptional regulator|tara:strand:+ start:697 stop:858 length:162 start_codon:yes stop_codon:yes gene_type:complete
MRKPNPKAFWIDPELHAEVTALADFQDRTIKVVVERALRKAIQQEAQKNDTNN